MLSDYETENCWEALKFLKLQRKNEINLIVNVLKLRKLGNQQPSSEKEKVQRLSRGGEQDINPKYGLSKLVYTSMIKIQSTLYRNIKYQGKQIQA